MKRLYERLGIEKGLTSVIGSGGKTTLIQRLAEELHADGFRVIVTTSTRILIPDYCPLVCNPAESRAAFESLMKESGIVAVGRPLPTKEGPVKLKESELPFEKLAALADYVLVEADGSKHLPLKAHAAHEPVVPACSSRTVQVLGLWGIGRPAGEAVHRPELFTSITGLGADEPVSVEAAAALINKEDNCDIMYFSGKSEDMLKLGRILEGLIKKPVIMEGGLWNSDR